MWSFKGTLWNSTQNSLPIHWKMLFFLYNTEFLELRYHNHFCMWYPPRPCSLCNKSPYIVIMRVNPLLPNCFEETIKYIYIFNNFFTWSQAFSQYCDGTKRLNISPRKTAMVQLYISDWKAYLFVNIAYFGHQQYPDYHYFISLINRFLDPEFHIIFISSIYQHL